MSDGRREVLELGFVPKKPVGVALLAADRRKERVAVCRVNGSIELWSVDSSRRPYVWRERSTAGKKGITFRGLAWLAKDRKIAAATLGGQILIFDASNLRLIDIVASQGGPIWAMDTDPKTGSVLAVGCDDARVRFFESTDDELVWMPKLTTMVRPGVDRLLCVSFSPGGKKLYYGDSDGAVLCTSWREAKPAWNTAIATRTQTFVSKATARESPQMQTLPWCILEVESSVIVGTSTGEIKVLDPHTGLLLQSLRTHKSDILCLSKVDETVYASGVDNILATLNYWDGEWVRSEGRTWAMCDVTSMAPLDHGILLTGSLDGFVIACETREMFPAKAATGKASVLHVHQPDGQHTYPFRSGEYVASVEDYAVTLHKVPSAKSKTSGQEIVAVLRYQIQGDDAIVAFSIDAQGRQFAFSTATRTCLVALSYTALDDAKNPQGDPPKVSASVLTSRSTALPAAESLQYSGNDLYIGHASGVTISMGAAAVLPDDDDSDLEDPILLPGSLSHACSLAVYQGHVAVASDRDKSSGSVVTVFSPAPSNSAGVKRKRGSGSPSYSVSFSKTTSKAVKCLTFCTVAGQLVVFVLLLNGDVVAFNVASGSSVWGTSSMPMMQPLSRAQWVSSNGRNSHVLLCSNDWVALLDVAKGGYASKKTCRLHQQARENSTPSSDSLVVIACPLQGAHVLDNDKVALISAPLDKLLQFVPPCFWRKQFAT